MAGENTKTDSTETEPKTPQKLKKIDALNDYIALLVKPVSTADFELTEEAKAKFSNEGVVIGIGPEVNHGNIGTATWDYTGTDNEIKLGDRLVVRGNRYQQITPKSGVYADQIIIMVHKLDMVLRHSRATAGEFDFYAAWAEDDTNNVRNEVAT